MKAFNLIFMMFVLIFTVSCEKKDDDCNDGNSLYELNFSIDHQANDVSILATDLDNDCDGMSFDFLIIVAPLNGVSSSEEIAFALKNNSIYNQRIAIEEEGVKQHSVNLTNLDENDDTGQLMIYAVLSLKVPLGMTPAEYQSSSDYNPGNFKMLYFGVYEGGDVPDLACAGCEDETCEDGITTVICTCHGGFCLCQLCPWYDVF